MDLEDLEPRKRKPKKRDLDPLGLEELRDYVLELKEEIERTQEEIRKKEKHRQGLDGLFKS